MQSTGGYLYHTPVNQRSTSLSKDKRTQRDPVCAGQETGPLSRRFETVVESDHGPIALTSSRDVTYHFVSLQVACSMPLTVSTSGRCQW